MPVNKLLSESQKSLLTCFLFCVHSHLSLFLPLFCVSTTMKYYRCLNIHVFTSRCLYHCLEHISFFFFFSLSHSYIESQIKDYILLKNLLLTYRPVLCISSVYYTHDIYSSHYFSLDGLVCQILEV